MASWESGMKVDPVAFCSFGVYSEVYGAGEEANIANQFASLGMLEDAPAIAAGVSRIRKFLNFFGFFSGGKK
jgi:hypothetical protein